MTLVLDLNDVLNEFHEARVSQNASQGIDEGKKSSLTLLDLERDAELPAGASLTAASSLSQLAPGLATESTVSHRRSVDVARDALGLESGEVRIFETSTCAGFVFRRREPGPGARVAASKSVLGELVGPIALLSVQVTFRPSADQALPPESFRLEIPKNGNFSALILATVKRVNADLVKKSAGGGGSGGAMALWEENAEAYTVHMLTSEDGKMREGAPLEHKRLVFRHAAQHFLVQPDPGTQAKPAEVLLKINLPAGQKHTVTVPPTLKVIALLPEVCEKRKMEPADYTLLYKYGNVPKDLTAADVAAQDALLHIVAKDALRKEDEDDQSDIFWYRKLAEKYKRYNVLYIHSKRKKETKEESILGIDGAHVSHTVIKKNRNKQYPPIAIADVKACVLLTVPDDGAPQQQRRFAIEFADGTSKLFEAGSNQLAREIVGKLQFLLQ